MRMCAVVMFAWGPPGAPGVLGAPLVRNRGPLREKLQSYYVIILYLILNRNKQQDRETP